MQHQASGSQYKCGTPHCSKIARGKLYGHSAKQSRTAIATSRSFLIILIFTRQQASSESFCLLSLHYSLLDLPQVPFNQFLFKMAYDHYFQDLNPPIPATTYRRLTFPCPRRYPHKPILLACLQLNFLLATYSQ